MSYTVCTDDIDAFNNDGVVPLRGVGVVGVLHRGVERGEDFLGQPP